MDEQQQPPRRRKDDKPAPVVIPENRMDTWAAAYNEIGHIAAWAVTSAKHGNGVAQLRDDDSQTYWQSDGAQPHAIEFKFPTPQRVTAVAVLLNYDADESYTPKKLALMSGSHPGEVSEVATADLESPNGWVIMNMPNDDEPFSVPPPKKKAPAATTTTTTTTTNANSENAAPTVAAAPAMTSSENEPPRAKIPVGLPPIPPTGSHSSNAAAHAEGNRSPAKRQRQSGHQASDDDPDAALPKPADDQKAAADFRMRIPETGPVAKTGCNGGAGGPFGFGEVLRPYVGALCFGASVIVVANHQNGRDTHIRGVRVYGEREEELYSTALAQSYFTLR